MSRTARTGPDWSWQQLTTPGSPWEWQVTEYLDPRLLSSQMHYQGAFSEVKLLESKLVFIWNANSPGGSLSCSVTKPAPCSMYFWELHLRISCFFPCWYLCSKLYQSQDKERELWDLLLKFLRRLLRREMLT